MAYINITYDKFTYTAETIGINSFDLSVPGKELFKNSKLSMSPGNIYGLTGKNGSGKSCLLKKLLELKNESKVKASSIKINTLYVEQEIELDDRLPIDYVLDSNFKQRKYEKELDEINQIMESEYVDTIEQDEYDRLCEKADELTHKLGMWNLGKEKAKVARILNGLGFTIQDLEKPSNLFSGGWQMRLSLARALYLEPDLLLLDEPTNHLDLEAIIWLSDYLSEWKYTVIVVSHNIGFLNDVCTHIINIEDKKLVQYKGNYSLFKSAFQNKQTELISSWEKYEKKLKELKAKHKEKSVVEEFISKNYVKRPEKTYEVEINFFDQPKIKSNLISLDDVSFGYDDSSMVLSNINLGIDMDSRIVLVGPNGSGKSTLIKLMVGEIKPTSGDVYVNSQCRIGYYNQHFENQLPLDKTPIDYLKSIISSDFVNGGQIEQSVRSYLGDVKLEPSAHTKKISELSGGQKARVAIVKLIFLQPHCLILDEPTNHLDIETVEAIIESLVNFNGGILVITHEPELIDRLDAQVLMMDPKTKKINKTIYCYDDYCKHILKEIQQ